MDLDKVNIQPLKLSEKQVKHILVKNDCLLTELDCWYGDTLYGIFDVHNDLIGLVSVSGCTINALEIFEPYKNKGYATAVVEKLFTLRKTPYLYGEAYTTAIDYWKRIGANFEMSAARLNEYKRIGLSACFKIYKRTFMTKKNKRCVQ